MQSQKPKKIKKSVILNERFQLIKSLGKGQYSEVFHAIDLENQEEVALKYQQKSPFHSNKTTLYQESLILENLRNIEGVPNKKYFLENKSHDLLILPIYKETLKNLYDRLGKFSLKTVILLALEIFDILEHIHEKNIIHLDLKPENIMIGTNDKSGKQLFIIDYGLSKNYIDQIKKSHIEFNKTNIFTGTYSYASLNSHLGFEQSRRDDLESLGYILIYFLKGNLPWQFFEHEDKNERMRKSQKLKKEISIEVLCKDMPAKLKDYFNYVRGLKFEEKPDYEYLRGLFKELKKENGIEEVENGSFSQWIEKENSYQENLNTGDDEYDENCKKISEKYFHNDNLKFNNCRHLKSNSSYQNNENHKNKMNKETLSPKK